MTLSACSSSDDSNTSANEGNPVNSNSSIEITDNNQPDNNQPENSIDTVITRLPAGGNISDPEFTFAAVAGASSYRLVIEDDRNDSIAEQFSAQLANCLNVNDACVFKPSVQIHDSVLNWRVESFDSAGEFIQSTERLNFNTLRSLTAQPYTCLLYTSDAADE